MPGPCPPPVPSSPWQPAQRARYDCRPASAVWPLAFPQKSAMQIARARPVGQTVLPSARAAGAFARRRRDGLRHKPEVLTLRKDHPPLLAGTPTLARALFQHDDPIGSSPFEHIALSTRPLHFNPLVTPLIPQS